MSYTDCNGEMYEDTFQQYRKCCDPSIEGDNCNYETIDIDSCTRSTEYETLFQDYYSCLYAEDGAYREYACDDYVTEITCDAIEALYSQQMGCYCVAYSGLYALVSETTGESLQDAIDGLLSSSSQWNDILDCNIDVTCDLSAGTVIGGGTSKPSPNPTPLPTQSPVISNKCKPECDEDTEVCLANGECQAKVSETACTSTSQCRAKDGENFVCETENDGGFCYYDECVASGSCDDGYACVSSTDTQDGIEYESGVCEEIGGVVISAVERWGIMGAIVVTMVMIWIE